MKKIIFAVFCATATFTSSMATERATEVDYYQKERENLEGCEWRYDLLSTLSSDNAATLKSPLRNRFVNPFAF